MIFSCIDRPFTRIGEEVRRLAHTRNRLAAIYGERSKDSDCVLVERSLAVFTYLHTLEETHRATISAHDLKYNTSLLDESGFDAEANYPSITAIIKAVSWAQGRIESIVIRGALSNPIRRRDMERLLGQIKDKSST